MNSRGFSQFSISLKTYHKEVFIDKMDEWGYNSNIRDVYSLEDFLRASIHLPETIVLSFNYLYRLSFQGNRSNFIFHSDLALLPLKSLLPC